MPPSLTRVDAAPAPPQVAPEHDIELSGFAAQHHLTPEVVRMLNPLTITSADPAFMIKAGTELSVMRRWDMDFGNGDKLTFFIDNKNLSYCTRHSLIRTVARLVDCLYNDALRGGRVVALCGELAAVLDLAEVKVNTGSNGAPDTLAYNQSNGNFSEKILANYERLVAAVFPDVHGADYARVSGVWRAYATFNELQQMQVIQESDVLKTDIAARDFFVKFSLCYPSRITPYIVIQGASDRGQGGGKKLKKWGGGGSPTRYAPSRPLLTLVLRCPPRARLQGPTRATSRRSRLRRATR